MKQDYKLINNTEKLQYEFHINRHVPLIEYIVNKDGNICLTHTEVPTALGGKGVGTQLVEKTLEEIGNRGFKVIPICPFVAKYIKKNPMWKSIVAEGITIR
ncbi:GNAT family N-acetyltransferase [Bacteroides sp. 519]|uniref:GNAT family N-acetyltransferase n=1 Tax=Bacteroides sp. 519 TaxID=2302937 RepID=UPI0013D4B964|nr:GNAT family N-acetyltransferase [Bacteroides sp. 519]NDV58142.1 N-acetyltransferase [Bacteroides sp. 519]